MKKRHNLELEELFKELDIMSEINKKARMDRPYVKAIRQLGKPRLR